MAQEKLADNVSKVSEAEWETVVEESGTPIDFAEVGSVFIGTFLGTETIKPEGWEEANWFTQLKFRDELGNTRTINAGYKLLEGFGTIEGGTLVRVTRVPDVPISDAGKNPMKDYRIEVAKG